MRPTVLAAACLLLGSASLACTAGGGEGDASAECRLLQADFDLARFDITRMDGGRSEQAPPRTLRPGALLEQLLRNFDDERVEVIIYLAPELEDEDLAAFAEVVEAQRGVRSVESVDEAATFVDFQELFEGNPTMLANVTADDLPSSVRVLVDSSRNETLVAWARNQRDVYDVALPLGSTLSSALTATMSSSADRDAWQELADDLDDLPGSPTWAETSAALVRALIDDAAGLTTPELRLPDGVTSSQVRDAADGIDEVLATC